MITFPSGAQQLPGKGFYEISGLAWSGGGAIKLVEVSTDGGKKWNKAEFKGTPQRMAHTRFGYQWNWDGKRDRDPVALHRRTGPGATDARPGRQVLEQTLRSNIQRARVGQQRSAVAHRERRERDQWVRVGCSRSRSCCVLLMGASALAQGPTYGIGRTPTPEEIKARDISISPTGEELPPGKGTAKEGAQLYRTKGCAACHGATGHRGHGSQSEKQRSQEPRCLGAGTNPAASRAVCDDCLGLHQSRHASQ